jgi:hypothetical protein
LEPRNLQLETQPLYRPDNPGFWSWQLTVHTSQEVCGYAETTDRIRPDGANSADWIIFAYCWIPLPLASIILTSPKRMTRKTKRLVVIVRN